MQIEDAKEELDEPGEFYYDRQSRELIYLPMPDEQLDSFEAWAPQLITPVSVQASNVMIEKLSVIHAAADMDGFFIGDCDGQSASNLHTGAIVIYGSASKVTVSEVEVRFLLKNLDFLLKNPDFMYKQGGAYWRLRGRDSGSCRRCDPQVNSRSM